MKVLEETGGNYRDDNHENLPIGLAFIIDGCRYSIFRVNEEDDVIICVSRTNGFTYFGFEKLEELLEEGRAFFVLE